MFVVGESLSDEGTDVICFGCSRVSSHPWRCYSSVLLMFVGACFLSTLFHPWRCAPVLGEELVEFGESGGSREVP